MLRKIHLSDELWAVPALHTHFNVPDNVQDVLWAAFDWYFVPRSDERIAYAKRVVAHTFESYLHTDKFPDWFWRVHALTIDGVPTDDVGIMPPLDPKDLPSP